MLRTRYALQMLARAGALGLSGRLRVARLLPLVFAPLATGCTLWYLIDDPFDGLGGGADSGSASSDGTLQIDSPDTLPDGALSDCGPLNTVDNCGACGVACAAGVECFSSTVNGVGGPNQCGATPTAIVDNGLQAITVANDHVYVLDVKSGVWECDDDCATYLPVHTANTVESGCFITTTSRGLAWSEYGTNEGIYRIELDGGNLTKTAATSPQVIAAGGPRLVWTTDPSAVTCTAFTSKNAGTLVVGNAASAGVGDAGPNEFPGVDVENAAIIDNGANVATTFNHQQAILITSFLPDGGAGVHEDFGDAGKANVLLAGDGKNLFYSTEGTKTTGAISERVALSNNDDFIALTTDDQNGAPLFVGSNGVVYWSDNGGSLNYCMPPDAGVRCDSTVSLSTTTGNKLPVNQIVATSKHIFFTMGQGPSVLYRIDPLP